MNVQGYDFYGQSEQSQEQLIETVNDLFTPKIQEIEGGMCYMLAIQFLLDYLGQRAMELTPEEIFDRLTRNSTAYLRQIAGNFRGYIDSRFSLGNLENQTKTYIDELSRGKYQGVFLQRFASTHLPMNLPEIDALRKGHLIVLFYKKGHKTVGHAVALVMDRNGYALYDPNFGVYRLTSSAPLRELYGTLFPRIYCPTTEVREYVFAVNKWKID